MNQGPQEIAESQCVRAAASSQQFSGNQQSKHLRCSFTYETTEFLLDHLSKYVFIDMVLPIHLGIERGNVVGGELSWCLSDSFLFLAEGEVDKASEEPNCIFALDNPFR